MDRAEARQAHTVCIIEELWRHISRLLSRLEPLLGMLDMCHLCRFHEGAQTQLRLLPNAAWRVPSYLKHGSREEVVLRQMREQRTIRPEELFSIIR